MSRYNAQPLPAHAGKTVTVGWDRPLATFFATVVAGSDGDDDEAVLFWIGTSANEIGSAQALRRALADFAALPDELVAQLHADFLADLDRNSASPLQRAMRAATAADPKAGIS